MQTNMYLLIPINNSNVCKSEKSDQPKAIYAISWMLASKRMNLGIFFRTDLPIRLLKGLDSFTRPYGERRGH